MKGKDMSDGKGGRKYKIGIGAPLVVRIRGDKKRGGKDKEEGGIGIDRQWASSQ